MNFNVFLKGDWRPCCLSSLQSVASDMAPLLVFIYSAAPSLKHFPTCRNPPESCMPHFTACIICLTECYEAWSISYVDCEWGRELIKPLIRHALQHIYNQESSWQSELASFFLNLTVSFLHFWCACSKIIKLIIDERTLLAYWIMYLADGWFPLFRHWKARAWILRPTDGGVHLSLIRWFDMYLDSWATISFTIVFIMERLDLVLV